MKRVTIVGGGFSGLTTAYYLATSGVPVTLLEKDDRLGGMVDTLQTPYGLVETAASGIRSKPHDNMELVVADFTRKVEAITDTSLDRVFCISVAEETGDSLPLALQEFYRCLKPGGLCVLTCDVQYDLEKPPGPYQAVKMERLEEAAIMAGFRFDGFNEQRDRAVNNPALNLCVFHCVLRKP